MPAWRNLCRLFYFAHMNTNLTKVYPLIGASGTLKCTIFKSASVVSIHCSGGMSTVVTNASIIGSVSDDLIPASGTGYIRCGSALTAAPVAAATDQSFPISAQVTADGKVLIANDYGVAMYSPEFNLVYSVD